MSTALPTVAQRLRGVEEYYFSRKLAEVARRRAAGEEIVNLGIGNPDLPPPPGVIAAMRAAAAEPGANGYQSYRGIAQWREALLKWYADVYGVALSQNQLLPLSGSKEGIVHLAMAFVEPGRALMHPDPGYPAYAAGAKLAGGTSVAYPMPSSGEESGEEWVARIAAAAEGHAPSLLFVNTPHMPTGQVLTREQLTALVAFAKTRQIVLVGDNAYNYYAPGGPSSLLSIPGAMDCAVELNSLSKSHHMPGWRLGVLAGRDEIVQAALQVKSNLDSGQYLPVQRGAAEALSTPWSWHAERNATLLKRRAIGEELLRSLGCTVPTGQAGLFVWAVLPEKAEAVGGGGLREGDSSAEAFADDLLDRTGLFLPPGTVFGPGGEGHIRLSLCAPVEVLTAALARVQSAAAVPA